MIILGEREEKGKLLTLILMFIDFHHFKQSRVLALNFPIWSRFPFLILFTSHPTVTYLSVWGESLRLAFRECDSKLGQSFPFFLNPKIFLF